MHALRQSLVLVGLMMLPLVGSAAHAADNVLQERSMGNPKAPVTLHEYSSLTCVHCATFHNETLPELKKLYVDTGKLRVVLHSFPLDGNALKAAALSYCMPEAQYFPFVTLLFKNIMQWAVGGKTDETLVQYAKLGGLGEEKAKSCLTDTKLLDALVTERTNASKKYDIQSTPTFIINDNGERIIGGQPLANFVAALDRALAAKK